MPSRLKPLPGRAEGVERGPKIGTVRDPLWDVIQAQTAVEDARDYLATLDGVRVPLSVRVEALCDLERAENDLLKARAVAADEACND